ncbi:MAG TPA: interleukin-like EMT inducer domain-containing protein [Candidatus Hydrogenedentes bacterium]|nr:interleukin-like EMT inducer domain-containing protein [Candidatus Hydrogenedentota bacterium]HPG69235.1 interleukin-like EMT inducer domain-containing protein [Candidatus Hydrogenedentota bacterium]
MSGGRTADGRRLPEGSVGRGDSTGVTAHWRGETLYVAVVTVGLFVVFTWPLAAHPLTQAPGADPGGDTRVTLWAFWWGQSQIAAWFPNPFDTDAMFYPLGTSLVYHALFLFYCAWTAPVAWLAGIVAAVNAACLWTFIVSAVAGYWLARRLGLSRGAAWLAALLFAFSPFRLWRMRENMNFLANDWFAVYAVLLAALPDTRRSWLVGLLMGLAMAGCAYCNMTFAVLLVLLSALYIAVFLRPWRAYASAKRIVAGFAVAVVVAAVLAMPMAVALAKAHGDYNYYVKTGQDEFSADLVGFVAPPETSSLWRVIGAAPDWPYVQEGVTFVGFAALALAGIGFVSRMRDRRIWFWRAALGLFFVLSLGPALKVAGQRPEWFGLPLPQALFAHVPLLENARAPERFHAMTTLPFALFAGLGWMAVESRLRASRPRVLLTVLVATLCLAEYGMVPFDTFRPNWRAFEAVRADTDDVTVLDGTFNRRPAVDHQVGHGKPIITGRVARLAPEITAYFRSTPVLREFAAEVPGTAVERFMLEPGAADMVRNVLDFLDIRYVVIDGVAERHKLGLFEGVVPCACVAADGPLEVYRVDAPRHEGLCPARITVGDAEWSVYLAHGWGQWIRHAEALDEGAAIWPASPRATVLFKSDGAKAIRFECDTCLPATFAPVDVAVAVNGCAVGRFEVQPGRQTLAVDFDAAQVRAGLNEVELTWPVEGGRYTWGDGDAWAPPHIFVASGVAGERSAFVNGQVQLYGQIAYRCERGYNLVELSDSGRRVVGSARFDPHREPGAWARLVAYVDAIPEGRLVAFIASNEAARGCTAEAVAALGRLGSAFDMRGKRFWSHAGLGRKGMAPGQAIENAHEGVVAFLVPGRCAFTEFRFER